MIRQSVPREAEALPDTHPLFSPDARQKLRAIEVSDVWLALRAGLHAQREALLATPLRPEAGETLEARWGAIQQLSLLLNGGPQMILQYSQLAAAPSSDEPTREYSASAHKFEG